MVENMRSGKFLINSLDQRQNTLKKYLRKLSNNSQNFSLKQSFTSTLTMQQIADDVGVHETTISRAIANKYAKLPMASFL